MPWQALLVRRSSCLFWASWEEWDKPSETDSDQLLFGSAGKLLAPCSRLCWKQQTDLWTSDHVQLLALYTSKLSLKNDPIIQHRNTGEGTLFPSCIAEYKGTVIWLKHMLTEVLTRTVAVFWMKILCGHFCFPFWIWRFKRELFDLLSAFCVEHRLETFDLPLLHPVCYFPTNAGLCNEDMNFIFLKWWRQKWFASTNFLPTLSGVKIDQKLSEPIQKCLALSEMCFAPEFPVFLSVFSLLLKAIRMAEWIFPVTLWETSAACVGSLKTLVHLVSPSSLQGLLGRHACDSVISNSQSPLPTRAWAT